MIKKKLLMSAVMCFLAAGSIFAAAEDGSPLFRKARDFYIAGQYDSTIALIREHLLREGRDPETVTLVPLIVEAYMRKGEHSQVHRLIAMYRQKFPDASFIPRLTYQEGVAFAMAAKPVQALSSFSTALDLGVSAELYSLTLVNVEHICSHSLSAGELSKLAAKTELHANLLEIVKFYEIQKLAETGHTARVRNRAEEFVKQYPDSRYTEQVRAHLGGPVRERRSAGHSHGGSIQVGLLAPLTGEDAAIGQLILHGVNIAIDDYNARAKSPIKLIVYDTKGSPMETARRSKDLLFKDHAQVCIGPVLSNTAVVSAAMFAGKDIVMITPTANEDGISDIGDNIFQMNVTLGTMAHKLANYAIDNLSIREFAIIAPNSTFGHVMAEAFKNELGRHNIEVVHEDYVNEGLHDFTPALMRLRYKLLLRRLEARAAQRGETQGTTRISRADSIRYTDTTFAVGGLFMPLLDYEDVIKLAPQAVFRRVRTQMLGSGGWYDSRVPAEGGRYVSNAIIAVGMQPDTDSEAWKNFNAAYKARFNADPNRISAMSYDAARLVIRAIEEAGGADTEKLKKALSSVQNYSGLSGIITFDQHTGANSGAAIMKVTETGFMRVQ